MPRRPPREGDRRDPSTCTRIPDRRPGALAGASRARGRPDAVGLSTFAARPGAPNPDPAGASSRGFSTSATVEGRDLLIGRATPTAAAAARGAGGRAGTPEPGGSSSPVVRPASTRRGWRRRRYPIVAIGVVDPVGQGWAQSLAHPGGNLTGLAVSFPELGPKLLEVLKEARPGLARIAVLRSTADSARDASPVLVSGARALGLDLQWLDVADASDLEPAVERAAQGRAQGLYAPATNLIVANRRASPSWRSAPACRRSANFVMAQAGFVLSYGTDLAALARRGASFVDKIVKGARPAADLPIELPSKFELVANLGAARAIGLTLPAVTLRRADRLIA